MNLKYQKVTNDNWEIAFNIQKILWPNTPDIIILLINQIILKMII